MKRILTLGTVALAGILTSACLVRETSETWYVAANGEVHWVVTEKDVRSDAKALPDRQDEESGYWLAVQQERHPIAAGLRELGGSKVRTLVLRGESPYTVQTDAKFSGLDEIGRRIIAAIGGMGTSIVTRESGTWEWKFVLHDPSAERSVAEPSEGVSALINDIEHLRIVLVSGRFEEADGFDLSDDRRVATIKTLDDRSHDQPDEPIVTLRLVWK